MKLISEIMSMSQRNLTTAILHIAFSTDPLIETDVEKAVLGLYKLLGKPMPRIIYCDSPWQMSMIPILNNYFDQNAIAPSPQKQNELRLLREYIKNNFANNDNDFYKLPVERLFAASEQCKQESPGAMQVEQFHRRVFDRLDSLIMSSDLVAKLPEVAEKLSARIDHDLQNILMQALGRTIVPMQQVGQYFALRDQNSSDRTIRNMTVRVSPSPMGEFFDSIYEPYYYSTREEQLPVDSPSKLLINPSPYKVEHFNLLTKNSKLDLFAKFFAGATLLTVSREQSETLQLLLDLINAAHDYAPFDNICLVSRKPKTVSINASHALHNETGPALEYEDGYAVFAVDGIVIPPWIVEHPERISVDRITREENTEIRRIQLKKFGEERYIEECASIRKEDSQL